MIIIIYISKMHQQVMYVLMFLFVYIDLQQQKESNFLA